MAASAYTRDVLRVVIAQICKTIGWQSIQTTPLEVLTDILSRYIHSLGTSAHRYGEQFGHTEPTLLDIDLAFKDLGVSVPELKEYVQNVTPVPCAIEVPKYPVERESHLNLLKPGSREVVTRPVHIYDHLPPMHLQLEEEPPLSVSVNVTGSESNTSPLPSPKNSLLKRPGDSPCVENHSPKQTRMMLEEEGPPLRELSSVIMTTSGFLSSAREGRLPEAIQFSNWKSYHTDPSESNHKKFKSSSVTEGIRKLAKNKKKKKKDPISSQSTEHVKKLASMKKMSKIKNFKLKAIKMRSPNKEMKKTNKHKNAPGMSALMSSLPKIPKLNQKNSNNKKLKDGPKLVASILDETMEVNDDKLSSKPDRQKLNIFKKISKVKQENINVLNMAKINLGPTEEFRQQEIFSETIEAVIQKNMEQSEDVEVVEMVSSDSELFSYNDILSPSGILPPSLNPDLIPFQKQSEDQDFRNRRGSDLHSSSPKCFEFKSTDSTYSLFEHNLRSPEAESTRNDAAPVLQRHGEDMMASSGFRLFPFAPGPGLVPSFDRLKLQLDEPQIKLSPLQPMSPAFILPVPLETSPVTVTSVSAPALELGFKITSPPRDVLVEKQGVNEPANEEHNKIKKKKIKKNKLKSKEENNKAKSCTQIDEQYKPKEKKVKKEKKKEKERGEQKMNEISIPKLTLKLGPPSPQSAAPELTPCKIVIKRIEVPRVKEKEVQNSNPDSRPFKSKLSLAERVAPSSAPSTSFNQQQQAAKQLPKKPKQVASETDKPLSFYFDEQGVQVWLCPACGSRDDGSPMIACDRCDAWYHWLCVGIQAPPDSNKWFCRVCLGKKKDKKKKGKKQKK